MASYTIWYGAGKPIRAVGRHQVNLLMFAEQCRGWHTFKQDRPTKRAVTALASRGALEVKGDQFRFTYP